MLVDRLLIFHPKIARPLGVSQRPAVLLVEDNRYFRLGATAPHLRQLAADLAELADFAANAGINMSDVVDNCAVKFLNRTDVYKRQASASAGGITIKPIRNAGNSVLLKVPR